MRVKKKSIYDHERGFCSIHNGITHKNRTEQNSNVIVLTLVFLFVCFFLLLFFLRRINQNSVCCRDNLFTCFHT